MNAVVGQAKKDTTALSEIKIRLSPYCNALQVAAAASRNRETSNTK
jgi:hypothetical protein